MDVVDLARNLYELREAGYLVAADLDTYFVGADSDLAEAARLVSPLPARIPLDDLSGTWGKRLERESSLSA